MDIATRYFQDHPERTALEVANYLVRAWALKDQQDGDYGYGCCKQASSVPGFFNYLEREDGKRGIAEDMESRFNCYWGCDEEWLIKSLSEACDNQEVVDDVFADVYDQIKEQKKAEAEDEANRMEEAEKQEKAVRQALIDNPSPGDLASARDVLQKAYQVALGIRGGLSVPDNQVGLSCRILGCDLPVLREWYAHGTGKRTATTDSEDAVPDNLRIRLKNEYDDISKVVAKLREADGRKAIK